VHVVVRSLIRKISNFHLATRHSSLQYQFGNSKRLPNSCIPKKISACGHNILLSGHGRHRTDDKTTSRRSAAIRDMTLLSRMSRKVRYAHDNI